MKLFKVFFTIFCVFCLSLGLVACEFTTRSADHGEEYTAGITTDSSEFSLNVGDHFDPFQGVYAHDSKGNSVLDQVQVSHLVPLDENGCVKQSGTYQIKYVLELDGEKINLYRTLTVVFVIPETDALVVNGDFELGATDPFTKNEFDNGAATLSIHEDGANHELAVEITAVSWQLVSPRVETNAFALQDGQYYKATFKARAEEPRQMMVQIGQLLSAAPWFYGLAEQKIALTTQMQEFEVVFKADSAIASDLSKIQVLFGFGTIDNEAIATTVYLDDIKVEKTKVASLLEAKSLNPELADEAAAKATPEQVVVWYDQGGWCGAASTATATLQDGALHLVATQPEGSCWFATQAFLYSGALQGGNYTLSFDLDMSKAGTIKFGANRAANTAIKAVAEQAVVAGQNALSVTFDIVDDEQVGLAIQFGAEALGNIGDFEATISNIVLVRNGDTVIYDYADPNNLFGNPKGANFGGEGDSHNAPEEFKVWYVQDPNWGCGPVVAGQSQSYADGILTMSQTLTEENWWFAVQLFYTTKAIEAAGTHELTFKLNSNVAGEITINGVKTAIVVGDNEISVPFTNAANAAFTLSMQLGWEELVEGADPVSHQLLGASVLKLSEFAIDGQNAGTPEPQEAEMFLGMMSSVDASLDGENAAIANPGKFVPWFDQNWCGSTTSGVATLQNGVVTFQVTSVTGSCAFGSQLFYYGAAVDKDSTLTFILNSTVAGQLKLNNKMVDLVVGDNELAIDFANGEQIHFQVVCDTALGALTFVFSNFKLGDKQQGGEPEPQEGEMFLGMMSSVDATLDGENAAIANPGKFVPWFDQGWCNSYNSGSATLENGVVTFQVASVSGSCEFGSQLFYYGATVDKASILTCQLKSSVAGDVKINGEMKTLVQGINELTFELAAGDQIHFQIVCDTALGALILTFSNFQLQEKGEPEPEIEQLVLLDFQELTPQTDLSDSHWLQQKYTTDWVTMTGQMRVRTVDGSTVVNMAAGYSTTMMYTYTFDQVYKNVSKASCKLSNHWSGAQVMPIKVILILEDGSSKYLAGSSSEFYQFPVTTGLVPLEVEFEACNVKAFRIVTKSAMNGNAFLYLDDVALFGVKEEQPEPSTTSIFYTEGEGNKANHIEGAGVWLWVKMSEIGMEGPNSSQFSTSATVEGFTVVDNFLSDFDFDLGIVRSYVVLASAPVNQTIEVVLTITGPDATYTESIQLAA